VRSQ